MYSVEGPCRWYVVVPLQLIGAWVWDAYGIGMGWVWDAWELV
jgi:hypothetical protein